jgi:hypothetical protein
MTLEELAVLVRNLPQADTLELYRLEYVIRALHSEPQRALAIRVRLHLGMVVQFFDVNDGTFHSGRIVVLRERAVTIDDLAFNLRHTNVPYAAIDLRTPPAQAEVEVVVASPPPRPAAKVPARAEFKVGDRVTFNDRDNVPVTGTVSRVNQKTVSVTPDNKVGRWRVSAALLNHLVDI